MSVEYFACVGMRGWKMWFKSGRKYGLQGLTALHIASFAGNLEGIRFLLSIGADVEATHQDPNAPHLNVCLLPPGIDMACVHPC